MGGFNFRLSNHNVPPGSSVNPYDGARGAREFDGTGWTGYQKCPLKFFILCGYIDKVYTYLYMSKKIVTNILMGFKI